MATIVKCPHCSRFNVLKGHTFPRKISVHAEIPWLCKLIIAGRRLHYYAYQDRNYRMEIKNPIPPTLFGLHLLHSTLSAVADRSSALKLAIRVDGLAPLTTLLSYLTKPSPNKTSSECEIRLCYRTPAGRIDFAFPSLTLIQPTRLYLRQFLYIIRNFDFQTNAESISFQLHNDIKVKATIDPEVLHTLGKLLECSQHSQ